MTAGSGIAHSERSDAAARQKPARLFGVQSWVALPRRDEETMPSFSHHAKAALPLLEGEGKSVRLIAGSFLGRRSPIEVFSPLFYADAVLGPGTRLQLPAEHEERAAYLVDGNIVLGGQSCAPRQLLVFRPGAEIVLAAPDGARLMLLGGAPLDGPRHIWWNFVSSSRERIEAAKADWRAGRFGAVIGDADFIPLPE